MRPWAAVHGELPWLWSRGVAMKAPRVTNNGGVGKMDLSPEAKLKLRALVLMWRETIDLMMAGAAHDLAPAMEAQLATAAAVLVLASISAGDGALLRKAIAEIERRRP
ncbi:MAG TPA: hypothetical protein VNE82_12740 [Candidatus Binataceae bacterium]|nr:hypothetical protein [Candidatus Binataceae bacterium]HVB80798.1 hypothetical protein [Candidatus Binataceae bacterium]